jgi:hypothetical protein
MSVELDGWILPGLLLSMYRLYARSLLGNYDICTVTFIGHHVHEVLIQWNRSASVAYQEEDPRVHPRFRALLKAKLASISTPSTTTSSSSPITATPLSTSSDTSEHKALVDAATAHVGNNHDDPHGLMTCMLVTRADLIEQALLSALGQLQWQITNLR